MGRQISITMDDEALKRTQHRFFHSNDDEEKYIDKLDYLLAGTVKQIEKKAAALGLPVAKFDVKKQKTYLRYPDGKIKFV